jgi:hypothetical protein
MKKILPAWVGALFACVLLNNCTPHPPVPKEQAMPVPKPAAEKPRTAPAGTAEKSVPKTVPAAKPAPVPKSAAIAEKPAPPKQAEPPRQKESGPYQYNAVDYASMGNEIILTKDKLLMEEENAEKDSASSLASDSEGGSKRYKVTQGYRIQVYATTNFKDAEKKKDDLLSVIDDPIYVVYDPPYYKIRAGNFEKEEQAKDLKKVLEEMGNDAWVVQSKIRIRTDDDSGKKKKR